MIKLTLLTLLSLFFTHAAFACFLGDTQIKMANGKYKVVKDIVQGDQVADMSPKSSVGNISQGSADIYFSSGSQDSSQNSMLLIEFGASGRIVVTFDHVFPTASGKFVKASDLRPGDQLISEDGKPVNLKSMSSGYFRGGVHNITAQSDLNPDNFVIANGIWSGTYKHQMYWNYGSIQDSNVFDDFPLNH